ncbi:MAG: hypothetical protein WC781_04520 [Candidatus Pacearchaeota archaeon]|jgi:hypothetical protein
MVFNNYKEVFLGYSAEERINKIKNYEGKEVLIKDFFNWGEYFGGTLSISQEKPEECYLNNSSPSESEQERLTFKLINIEKFLIKS